MAILSLQNVGYKVDTNEILKNINLDVNENEFITIPVLRVEEKVLY